MGRAIGSATIFLIGAVLGITGTALAQGTDPFDGRIVREIRVSGLNNVPRDEVVRQLATRVGEPFHQSTMALDERRLDELRMFSAVHLEPRLENDELILDVAVTETLRWLPFITLRVTDENGVSAGPGLQGINVVRGMQAGVAVRFGGETGVSVTLDRTTIAPDTWTRHFAFNYVSRQNALYDFKEQTIGGEARLGRNLNHGLKAGIAADITAYDTGSSGASLSEDGTDVIPTVGAFLTLDRLNSSTDPRHGTWAEVEVDRLFGDAGSWTVILDGRRFQRLAPRHGLGIFALTSFQTGEVSTDLPEYLQYALGGGNTVRGWGLGSRKGRNQFIGSLEYTYVMQPVRPFTVAGVNLYAGLQVVGFADLGYAWTDPNASSAIDGYGVGLRALVPFVDVVRFDLAWGEPGEGARFSFGVSLKATRQRQRVR